MKTYQLQVVGHAEYKGDGTFPVAKNWTYKFFVKDGEILSNAQASVIYDHLNTGVTTDKTANTLWEGSHVKNYAIWAFDEIYEGRYYNSGILQIGSDKAIIDIKGIKEAKPILLSNLLTLAVEKLGIKIGVDEVIVYYNVCR